jgi:hypothetical protein
MKYGVVDPEDDRAASTAALVQQRWNTRVSIYAEVDNL